jgi:two-component system alkaline phosphatase synthesis response regulator PhoP
MNKKIRVLVVDDEPDVVEILSYNLTKNDFEVERCYSGMEAIQAANREVPDVIIMDIRMPEMTGIETCRQIRQIEKLKDIPVLFLTADSDEYTTMNAFEAGASHFVTKPIKPAIITGMIKELLQNKI